MIRRLGHMREITDRYDVLLCDVWGVIHNGIAAWPQACAALVEAREAGLVVVLITNSPRPAPAVIRQLDLVGVPANCYDRIVTSGDVTRGLIADGPDQVYFLGPKRDHDILEGLNVRIVDETDAKAVLCTGFFDDERETPADYRALLERFRQRDLPFICANPDLVVERGDRLVYCAGAIAELYTEMGGETRISGKPHAPIYRAALDAARSRLEKIDTDKVLALGDGLATDVKGALQAGFDVVYISSGIHQNEYGELDNVDEARLAAFLGGHGALPKYWMERLT